MNSCDGCCICCKLMKVEELKKPGDSWCQHCKIGEGCNIYDTRPDSCRVYECVWLQTQKMDKPISLSLRPDKSRVVIGTMNQGEDVVLYVSQDRPDAWERGEFKQLVAEFQARRLNVYVSCAEKLTQL